MERTAAIVYHPGFLHYDFGPQHPLRPERITAGLDLLRQIDIWDPEVETLAPIEASRNELTLVHAPEYVDAVDAAGTSGLPAGYLRQFGFSPVGDNPPFPDMHATAALVAGGAARATRQLMTGSIQHAFSPAGGWHHAMRDRASGFCIYNDPALAAAIGVHEFDARVLYVDFDCHHGDGVQWLFYDDPRVLTVSFHESGRYLFPGTGAVTEIGEGAGRGYSVNVPFEPFTQDESWLRAVRTVLPPLVERFSPDLIISAHGADTHALDPLTHLSLTTRSFFEQAALIHRLAHEHADGRWLAVGSGGYDWRRVVPRSWSIVWAEMTERTLPDRLPDEWVIQWSQGADAPFPLRFQDEELLGQPLPRRRETDAANALTVRAAEQAAGLTA